jgi:anaerobic magnesium-protoporphyrin IX monomethyl ester cyclase
MHQEVLIETEKTRQKRILITNMPSSTSMYSESMIKVAVVPRPSVAMATIAACCLQEKIDVKLVDLSLFESKGLNPGKEMEKILKEYDPDYVCFSFTTPLFNECCEYAKFVKEKHPRAKLIAGGVHPTTYPEEVLEKSVVDIAVIGEGDFTLAKVIHADGNEEKLKEIQGIAFKNKEGKIIRTPRHSGLDNLDELPLPAWDLLPIKEYKMPKIMTKKNPVGTMETSRGCLAGCTYCNKTIFGRRWKFKSAKRVVDELEYMKKCGFNEVHIYDDMYTTDLDRAKDICDEIIRRGLKISWKLDCGIRIDSVDPEFYKKLKASGCYSVGYGLESGSQKILDNINKGADVREAYNAVKWAKEAGLETVGFFMFGLPGETEETMKETIKFAIDLNPAYAKVTLATPFPGTGFYAQMQTEGRLKSTDWSAYNFHTPSKVYDHPELSWEKMDKYYKLFYKKFYFRPKYLTNRLIRDLRTGNIFSDLKEAYLTFAK